MRLMFIITRGDSVGGAQLHVRDLTKRLAADGHDLHVVVGSSGLLTDELEAAGIPTSTCPGLLREVHPAHDLRAVAQLRRMIREFQPDLVTTHSSKAGMIGRIAARLTRTPVIFTVHGWSFIETVPRPVRDIYRWMEWGTARIANRLIVVSEQVVGMGEAAGIPRSKMQLVHNGLPDLPATFRADPGAGSPRAVMVARFAAPKDHLTVVRAMQHVSGLELDFVGDGPDEETAQALAAELGVTDKIFWATKVNVARGGAADPAAARAQIETSFARFKKPVIDLLQVHNLGDVPTQLPILKELKAQGRVRYIGVTTTSEPQYAELVQIMRNEPLDFIGVDYAVDNREVEQTILPLAAERRIGVLAYAPFGRTRLWSRVSGRQVPAWAADFDAKTWAQFFLKFVVSHPAITATTPATSDGVHMADNIGGAMGRLPDAATRRRMVELIDALPPAS
jgi:aryl-alcohol dehydrogenase-like predicted oxidoreductase